MNSRMPTNDPTNPTPQELRGTEAALEALARAERAAAPATLESRLFVATRAMLPAAPVVVRVRLLSRLRVAAAVAIVGGLSSLYLAQGGSRETLDIASLESDVDFALAIKTDGFGPSRESIDALYLDTHTISDSLRNMDATTPDDGAL